MLLQTHHDVCSIALFPHLSYLLPAATREGGRKHTKTMTKGMMKWLINHTLIWNLRENKYIGYAVLVVIASLPFQKANTLRELSALFLSYPPCFRVYVFVRSNRGFNGQIRPAWWLPLAEVAPGAGYWLSVWAAETSLPQTLHQQILPV